MAPRSNRDALREDVGQLLVMGFDGTEAGVHLSSLIRRLQPGGVILFARNVVTAQQTHRLLADCQAETAAPLFRCVDMEGGLVDRLKKAVAPAPSPAEVFATGNRRVFRRQGRIIGEECRAVGFNVDFAPSSDLSFPESRTVLGSRAVSAVPREVVEYVREFLRGLKEAKVLGCGKHFPGLGGGTLDSHHDLPRIEKSWKALWAEDLVPYRLLRREYPFVMVSHAAYPQANGEGTPASLSRRWITEVLRRKIGFRGLVVSDDLEMGGVLSAAPIEQASIQTVRAGTDLFLICHKEEYVIRSYEAMVREAERDRKFAARVAEAARRVAAFKKKHLSRRLGRSPSSAKVERLTRQLWEFAEQVRLESITRQETA